MAFGDDAPDAVALTTAKTSRIGCGESNWCAELWPEHFSAASNNAFSHRAAPHQGKVPPVVVGQQVSPRSAALPLAEAFLPFVTMCTHYVFAIREGGALRPNTHGTNCVALAAAWDQRCPGLPDGVAGQSGGGRACQLEDGAAGRGAPRHPAHRRRLVRGGASGAGRARRCCRWRAVVQEWRCENSAARETCYT